MVYLHHLKLLCQDKLRKKGFVAILKDGDHYERVKLVGRKGYWWKADDGRQIHSQDIEAIEDISIYSGGN